MSNRIALWVIAAFSLTGSAFAAETQFFQGYYLQTNLLINGVRVAQAEISKKCPVGYYWTCSKFTCYCQKQGHVYRSE
jgi:hypothetical protein